MPAVLTVDTITSTGCRFTFAGLEGTATTAQGQISTRKDFDFNSCPIFPMTNASPQSFVGLNQAQTYFARMRGVTAAGAPLPWSNVELFYTPLNIAQSTVQAAQFLDPALICIPEPILTLTPGNAVNGYPATNLVDDGPSVWQSTGTGGNDFTLGIRTSGRPIDTLAMLMTNIPENATIRLKAGATYAAAVGAADIVAPTAFRASANLPGRPSYHCLLRFAENVGPWFYIIINCDMPGKRLEAGHLVVGKSMVTKRIARDMGTDFEDLGVFERNLFGIPDSQDGYKLRNVSFDLAMLSETIYETVYAPLHARVGTTKPVLVVPNPKAGAYLHDRILYGQMKGGKVANPVSRFHTRSFNIQSII